MTVISVDNASFCPGLAVAEAVAGRRGWALVTDNDIFSTASEPCGVPAEELRRLVYGPARLLDGIKDVAPKQTAELRVALARLLEGDDFVLYGALGYLIPPGVTHVLKVGLVGSRSFRMAQALNGGLSKRKAEQTLRQDDESRSAWVELVLGRSPWDRALFDGILPVEEQSEDALVAAIMNYADAPAVAVTEESRAALREFRHSADLQLAFADRGHDVDIVTDDGAVEILLKKHTLFPDRLQQQLVEMAKGLDGVREATARPGPRYRAPSLYLDVRAELPSKVLLVDDEEAFVTTLSRRLKSREIDSTVALGGKEALDQVEADEPEVMVLDLKMPGIDGIEVLRNVKQNNPRTEVIILTAHGSEAEERLVFQMGAFAYLRKPVEIDELTETMQRAYQRVRAHGRRDE